MPEAARIHEHRSSARRPRFFIRAFGVCSTLVAASGCATTALLQQQLTKTNTQTVLAFEETVFNKHEVQVAFEHYIGEGFVEHDPALGAKPAAAGSDSRQDARRAYRMLIAREGADAHRSVERSIAQGDLVATQARWSHALPGASVLETVDIYRLQQGRIVEHWDVLEPVDRTPGSGGKAGGDAVPGESLPP